MRTLKLFSVLMYTSILLIGFWACQAGKSGGGGINLFSPEQDIELGRQVAKQIEDDPKQFPILPERGNEEIYRYVRNITNKILNSGRVKHKDDFVWQVKIIDDAETLNAFAAPGGFIYVYTGLIKFLDSEDQLAGVMGHEIAHADLRHSTRQMTKTYGISALLSIVTGTADPGLMQQIALSLVSLQFSRSHETESDLSSVRYLCGTDYNASGAAGFFKKMEGRSSTPAFLSTHPNPGNRVENIENKAKEDGCTSGRTYKSEYERIKRLIK